MDINCTAVNIEYSNSRCRKVHGPCATKRSSCAVSEFCSDKCRSMYHKVLRCRNNTIELNRLELLCAPSSDPTRYSTCLSRFLNDTSYVRYGSSCFSEIILGSSCMQGCNSSLMANKNDCCSVNLELTEETNTATYDERVDFHNITLWERCGVESPQICRFRPCPPRPMPMPRDESAGAPGRHVNWYILLLSAFYAYNACTF